MKKKLLINLTFCFLTFTLFSQNSGTFTGTFNSTNSVDTHSFTSTGIGKYIFTGSYTNGTSSDAVSPTVYIGTINNYNIGGNYQPGAGTLNFETSCVSNGQVIGLNLQALGSGTNHDYNISYQFVPSTFSVDTEPNDTFGQSINMNENSEYQGWLNNQNESPNDFVDWYKFTSPRNGVLVISIEISALNEITPILYNSNDLNTPIGFDNSTQVGEIKNYIYNNFNFNNQEFGIKLESNCVSYKMSWEVDNSSLSIEKYNLDKEIKLYPNPISDNLKVKINNEIKIEKVEIIEITGKLIQETNFINNSISVKSLTNGIYFVKIYSDKGITTKKIIKTE